MKRVLFIISILALMGVSATAFGQKVYVSQKAADALKGGKFYLKMAGVQSYSEDGDSMTVPLTMELAAREGVSMSRILSSAINVVSLAKGNYTYVLDEAAKTWRGQPAPSGMGDFPTLKFRRQGSCVVNGEQGWYFDEYAAGSGIITFYYNSAQPSIIDLGGQGEEEMGPMWLHSCTTTIPSNMYFCVGNDWKDAGGAGSGGAAAAAGVDMAAIEAQMRAQLKGQQLPPGMTVDDLVNQAMSAMGGGGKSGKAGAAPATPAPPKCSTPWRDSGTAVELACGFKNSKIVISEKRTLKDPVYASNFAGQAPQTHARTDINITAEGLKKAAEKINNDIQDLSDVEVCSYFADFNDKVSMALAAGVVTGEMVEMSIVSSAVHAHPLTLATTGTLYEIMGDPQIAFDYFKQADEIEPDNIIVEHGMVDCLMEMKRYSEARKVLPKIIKVFPQDGYSYLKMAMLDIQEQEFYAAADDLFKSLSLGYFDENSATMVASLLSACDAAAVQAYDGLDFKNFIDHVFSEKNIALLKKAIAFDYPNFKPQGVTRNCTASNLNGNLVALLKFNSQLAEKYDNKVSSTTARAEKAAESAAKKPIGLYWAMGMGKAGDNYSMLFNSVTDLKNVQKTLDNHAAAKKRAEDNYNKMSDAVSSLEDGYSAMTALWALEDGVAGYYLPDGRAFWCIRAYYRYCQYCMMYSSGDLAHGVDKNGDGEVDDLEGCFDPAVRDKLLSDIKAQKAYDKKCEDAQKEYDKMTPKTDEAVLKFMLLRAENDLKFISEYYAALIGNYARYYNGQIVPHLNKMWEEFSSLPQYCSDRAVQAYIENTIFSDIYEQMAAPYTLATQYGKDIVWYMDQVDHWRDALHQARLQRQQAQQAEVQAAAEAAQDEKLFDHGTDLSTSDFLITFPTPLGDISIGIRDGKIGYMCTDLPGGLRFGTFGGKQFSERIYQTMAQDIAKAGESAKKFTMDMALGKINGMPVEFDPKKFSFAPDKWKAAKMVYDAATGKLVQFDNHTWYGGNIGGPGNMHQAITNVKSMSFGEIKYSREVTRIGAAKRDKSLVTFPLPFLGSLTVGGYK